MYLPLWTASTWKGIPGKASRKSENLSSRAKNPLPRWLSCRMSEVRCTRRSFLWTLQVSLQGWTCCKILGASRSGRWRLKLRKGCPCRSRSCSGHCSCRWFSPREMNRKPFLEKDIRVISKIARLYCLVCWDSRICLQIVKTFGYGDSITYILCLFQFARLETLKVKVANETDGLWKICPAVKIEMFFKTTFAS